MSYERALNFDQWKAFSENYKPMRVWLWLVYKFTENYFRSWLFSEFIQTQRRYLPRQNTYPNLKTTCHIKLKFFLWTKPLENLLFAKYLISVTASLSWKDNKYYQLLFEQKRNFKINVCLMNQKAAMYWTFQFVDIWYIYIIIKNTYFPSWLLMLLGNHGTKGTNHILHNVSVFAFFWCIFSTNNLSRIYSSTILQFIAVRLTNSLLTAESKQRFSEKL